MEVLQEHREILARRMSHRTADLRHLSSGQTIFVLVMHDMETMRSATGLTSPLASYFVNDGLNKHSDLSSCMDSVAEKVRNLTRLPEKPTHLTGYARLHK